MIARYRASSARLDTYILAGLVLWLATFLMGCQSDSITGPSPTLTASPRGWFVFEPDDYGQPGPNHGFYAESRWEQVEGCLGLHYTPKQFTIRLRANAGGPSIAYFMSQPGNLMVGGRYHPRESVEVFGDPVWIQSWKHELMHYLLDMTTGNPDVNHTRGGLVTYGPNGEQQGADWLRCTTTY